MIQATIEKIRRETHDLPARWTEVLIQSLLQGDFPSEAHRLIRSAAAIHQKGNPAQEIAENILAGDAFIPMAIQVMLESGHSLEEVDAFLEEATALIK